jgi:hypothetical protein
MTGGLMQLVGKGAQDHLVIGNPSFTHFRNMYKRHTDFAMEHFRLTWKTTNLSIPVNNNLTLRARVERFAQLVHDCYLSVDLPNIFSGFYPGTNNPYEFQWVPNIGYNMLNHVSVLVNGQEIVRHTGEWMKLYGALNYQGNKVQVLDHLVGNLPEVYDPSNSFGRTNSYPHSISSTTSLAEPSIQGRTLTIPLHFWFCENVGAALPLVALQHSEVEIVVEFTNMFNIFTVLNQSGVRVAPNPTDHPMSVFLSPPNLSPGSGPSNPSLSLWSTNSFIEANYIFLTDTEMAHIAKTDHSFLITQVDLTSVQGQYGPSNDLLLNIKNLCTRLVWVAQRTDRALVNDVDNYTNWENPNIRPFKAGTLYSSGLALPANVSQRDILLESNIVIDGKDRFTAKQTEFFSNIQNYRHNAGRTIVDFPGLYSYSFALENSMNQPCGHINGSMFNKIILRNTYIQPPTIPGNNLSLPTSVCVLKSTASNPRPTIIINPNALGPNGKPLYGPNDIVRIITKSEANTLEYSYNVRAYVESYNYLRVIGGVANVVFSS